jgi:hypothetical protein
MKQGSRWWSGVAGAVFLVSFSVPGLAQEKTVSDAQVEANVLKALAALPELANQTIGSTTVYGQVTLTGTVESEDLRNKTEQAVANTPGVKKVIDELTIGAPATPATSGVSQPPEDSVDQTEQGMPQAEAPADAGNPPASYPPSQSAQQPAPVQAGPAPIERSQPDEAAGPQPPQSQGYPPAERQPYRAPQQAGAPVIIPAGTTLRVRINQAMDSRHTQPGSTFDGVVLTDVYAGGMVAIPRGAMIQGQVVDTHPGGDFKGRGGLALQLSQVMLEGHAYPLATDAWTHQGYDKTGQTVGTTAGLGAAGATIGAIAGGGPGALLGAGIGAIVGLGASSASHSGEATLPSEAIVNFRLSQQAALMTVSQAELDRLGAGLPPPPSQSQGLRRRAYGPYGPYGPPPPPPPYPYAYYPSPYYYPYYH